MIERIGPGVFGGGRKQRERQKKEQKDHFRVLDDSRQFGFHRVQPVQSNGMMSPANAGVDPQSETFVVRNHFAYFLAPSDVRFVLGYKMCIASG